MMRLEQVPGITSVPDVPNNTPLYATRRTPPGMPALHQLCSILGSRGAGKTTTLIRMLRMYVDYSSYDEIYIVSPTAKRDTKVKEFVEYAEKKGVKVTLKEEYSEPEFKQYLEHMKTEVDEYRKYLKDLEVWKRFKAVRNVDDLSLDDLIALDAMGWSEPETEYKHGFPSFAVVFDDCLGQKSIMTPSCKGTVASYAISHRHYSSSLFFLVQAHATGLPRGLRANISLYILLASKSPTLKKSISEEIAWRVDPDVFLRMWEYATEDSPYSFLMCEYDSKDVNKMFRKNFDKYIVWDGSASDASEKLSES